MTSINNLQTAANVLRRDVIEMTTQAGSGHLTSCLSCAEIMSALFFHTMKYDVKNPSNENNDEFILSKGHAAPILYAALKHAGCINDNLHTLRSLNSPLEGHPIPSEKFKWIKVATGSLGQGLSIGLGMALAGKISKNNFKVYTLLGDSEIAEGSVYEAMQLAEYYKLNNLIAIVDVNALGQTGETMNTHIENYKKRMEGFGWEAIFINGHDIAEIIFALKKANSSKKPVIILAKTVKGKGIPLIEGKNGWHGRVLSKDLYEQAKEKFSNLSFPSIKIIKPEHNSTKKFSGNKTMVTTYDPQVEISTREAYGYAILNLAKADSSMLVIDAEVSNSTYAETVKNNLPNQFIEAFIAERNMIGMALGLSKKNKNVFASTFAAFLTRAHDQLRMAAYSHGNFSVCGSHAGVSIGEDGVSQMGLEDIALFRSLYNSTVFYPSDAVSCNKLLEQCKKLSGIKYIRTTRSKTPIIYTQKDIFPVGDFKIIKKSDRDKIVLIGAGITLHESLKAYEELKNKNISAAVVDIYCIKPFNHKKLFDFIEKHGNKIIIVEDHYEAGGIGEMILANQHSLKEFKHLCIRKLPHSGKSEELLDYEWINARSIVDASTKLIH